MIFYYAPWNIRWNSNSQYLRMWSYLEIVLLQIHLVKMKSYYCSWPLIQYDLCPYKKREIWTQMHRGKIIGRDKENTVMWQGRQRLEHCINKLKNAKHCQKTLETRRGKDGLSSTGFRENMAPADILISDFLFYTLCCFKMSSFGNLLRQP